MSIVSPVADKEVGMATGGFNVEFPHAGFMLEGVDLGDLRGKVATIKFGFGKLFGFWLEGFDCFDNAELLVFGVSD